MGRAGALVRNLKIFKWFGKTENFAALKLHPPLAKNVEPNQLSQFPNSNYYFQWTAYGVR